MRLIGLVVVLAVSLFAAPLVGEAQQRNRIPRLCFLTFDPGTLQSNSRSSSVYAISATWMDRQSDRDPEEARKILIPSWNEG